MRKAYPDTILQLEKRGVDAPRIASGGLWQINLHSTRVDDLPAELFSDSTINWHQQQFGRPGLIAVAGLFVHGHNAYVSLLQSDLCQQIYRHPRLNKICASRINNRFRYWYAMLFNAVLDFASAQGLENVFSPTGAQIVRTTRKAIDGTLFESIYDFVATRYTSRREEVGGAEYWAVPVHENIDRIVVLDDLPARHVVVRPTPQICVYHDIEEDVDTDVSANECRATLVRMLEVERLAGVSATYNILGTLFRRVAPIVAGSGSHSIAFHTYDHQIHDLDQLRRVREVDLQVKGYRTAQSVITRELNDYSLSLYNFEWIMSSASSFGFDLPRVENGIVKIPAHIDDYPLSTGAETLEHWTNRLMEAVRSRSLVVVGFHDCYSRFWIKTYPQLLDRLRSIGEFRTCNQLLNEAYFNDAEQASN